MALSISRRTISLLALSLTLVTGACVQDLDVGGGSGDGTTTGSTTLPDPVCAAGELEACYDGPAGTEGVAACHSGTRTCAADGRSWGPCTGQVLPDFEPCAGPADRSCDGSTTCTAPTGWSQPFGPDKPDFSRFTASAVGPDHDLYLAGVRHQKEPTAGPGAGTTVFLLKVALDGEVLWIKDYDSLDAEITGLGVDQAGNVRVAGTVGDHLDLGGSGAALQNPSFESGGANLIFVAQLDPSGEQVWTHTYSSHTSHAETWFGADSAGNVVLWGAFLGTIDFGGTVLTATGEGSARDAFLVKLDPDGETIFARRQTVLSSAVVPFLPRSFRMDGSGGFVTGGQFGGDLDVGGPAPLHVDVVDGGAPSGAFLAAYDESGELLWQKAYTSEWAPTVGMSPTGEVVAAGRLTADTDFGGGVLPTNGDPSRAFVARWNAAGTHLQSDAFSAGELFTFNAISVRDDGIATVAATHIDGLDLSGLGGPVIGAGLMGCALFRLGSNDQIKKSWHWDYPLSGNDPLILIPRDDGMGGIYAYGWYSGAVDLGFGPLPSTASRGFIAHYVP